MKKQLRSLLYNYKKSRYNNKINNTDLKLVKKMEEEYGYKLDLKLKKKIDEYAKETFGSVAYAPSLYVYTVYNQEFKEGWIPDNYFGFVVAPKVNKSLGHVASMKTMSIKIIQTNKLPDKFYIIDQKLYDEYFNLIEKKNVENTLFSFSDNYFLKLDNSSQGRGVFKISRDTFELNEIFNKGDAVLQLPIKQSKFFDEIIEDSVATLRILTFKDLNGKINFAASFLRVGRKNEDIVQAASSIKIPIIDEEGTLNNFANADAGWKRYYEHPDTGYRFEGNKIPYFNNAVNDCLELHRQLPHVTIIAWDVSITDEGETKVIEWNAKHPGIKFLEACSGPMFKELGWEDLHKI